MIRILEVKIDHGRYMILIQILDDRLRTINDELEEHLDSIRQSEWNYYSESYNAMVNALRVNYKGCISELFTDTYSKVYEYCAGCNAHDNLVVGDVPKFPLKNRVSEPIRSVSDEQALPFGESNEMIVSVNEGEKLNLLKRLMDKGLSVIVMPDKYSGCNELLNYKGYRDVMIFTLEELYQLIKHKGYYFTSGLVAVIYPKDDSELAKQYVVIRNNLCGRESTKVIHMVERDVYIPQAGKNMTELVNGPSIKANVVFV